MQIPKCLQAPKLPVARLFFALFFLFLMAGPSLADFSGPVISVFDGDTLEVLHNQHPERIRLSGIDCPE